MKYKTLATLLLLTTAVLADSSVPGASISPRARSLWTQLPTSKSACADYDYFPHGGMRNFYCHLLSLISEKDFRRMAPRIFLSGPHGDRLNLKSRSSFGHYDPAFVRWLAESFIPAAPGPRDDVQLREQIYRKYLQPLARIYYVTDQKLRKNPKFLEQEKARLQSAMQKGADFSPRIEGYYTFRSPDFIANPNTLSAPDLDGNVVKTAVAFWIRRSIDGTDGEFRKALRKLLEAYDPWFFGHPMPPNKG